jgi:ABC-type phosphate/phosphonate transport system permease subunit
MPREDETMNLGSVEGIIATDANPLQILWFVVLPQVLRGFCYLAQFGGGYF